MLTIIISRRALVLAGGLAAWGCGGVVADSEEAEAMSAVHGELRRASRELFVPPPNPGAVAQLSTLLKARDFKNARALAALVTTPQAVWFPGGTPQEVERAVSKTMAQAAREHRVPVLVAYNLPFRDCAQYSAGGAIDTAAYQAWIDGFARGIGRGRAIVILEPDGLGIIPYNTTIYGVTEWCQPTVVGAEGSAVAAPGASPEERYAQLQYAGATLLARAPNAKVYLDGTHSAWLGVGEAAYRIDRAGRDPVTRRALTHGFFLNASNYQRTEELVQFGTWVSMCTAFATNPEDGGWRLGNFSWCASQYNPEREFALDFSPEYRASVTEQLTDLMGGATASLPFVLDTGRNGRGPLDVSTYAAAPYAQPEAVLTALRGGAWCNSPTAGAGARPTLETGVPLVDAFLWIKKPGESDGSCDLAGGARAWDYGAYNPWGVSDEDADHFDPLWGLVDPVAGAWFPEQALRLARRASPRL
jgi:endoglucanase